MAARRNNWTHEEDALLRQHYATTTGAELAQRVGRGKSATKSRIRYLGLSKSKDPEKLSQIRREAGQAGAAAKHGRSTSSIAVTETVIASDENSFGHPPATPALAAASTAESASSAPKPLPPAPAAHQTRDIGRDSSVYRKLLLAQSAEALKAAGLGGSEADIAIRAIAAGRVPGVRIEY